MLVAGLVIFALQIVLYHQSFSIQPAADDFNAPLTEILRGETQGPGVFFTRSPQPHNYRPLQSLGMWTYGRMSTEHRELWIRLLHFTGMAVYGLAGVLWIRRAARTRIAAVCGSVVLFAHPALVAPLASIDGFSGLFATGLMWLSTYVIWRWRDRLWAALPLALIIFIIAIGFKEYCLGAVPLACLAVMCFARSPREALVRAFIVGFLFSIVVLGFIYIRSMTIPPPDPGQEIGYFRADPVLWLRNAGLFAAVLLFPGSSVWVFLERSAPVIAMAGGLTLLVIIALATGLFCRLRGEGSGESRRLARRWIVFSLLGIAAASFPPIIVAHVSEMYAVGMIIPIAMLATLAADGLVRTAALERRIAAAFFAAVVVIMAAAVWSKVALIRESGETAVNMLRLTLMKLPPDARDTTIAVCYPPRASYPPRYSVFVMPEELSCRQPNAPDWLMPGRNLQLVFPTSLREAFDHADKYGLIVSWNPALRQMVVVQPPPASRSSDRRQE